MSKTIFREVAAIAIKVAIILSLLVIFLALLVLGNNWLAAVVALILIGVITYC